MKENKVDLTGFRENYTKASLTKESMESNPLAQFYLWMKEAVTAKITEPNAMVLSTVSESGFPSSRVILLKEIIDDSFVFYTNYRSEKAMHIEKHPLVSLNFLWVELQRQIRIQGSAYKVSKEISETYFKKRPRGSQIGAWVSPQSQILENRNILTEKLAYYTEKFKGVRSIPMPPHWGGYGVRPTVIEFWQGGPNRLHDRIRYTKTEEDTWILDRLAP